ncbi:DUF4124 domain-containing protein [Roseateles sp.]|uniref:DUF4124 domain-containing protein n=1 Tax=Roseateles sp. TaxID=1971397 RepID=UPI002F42E6DF
MASQAQKNVQRSDFGIRLQLAAIAVALTLPAVAVQAQQVYKWVDANGRVQYSERKPTEPDAASRTTEIKPPPPPQPVPTRIPMTPQSEVEAWQKRLAPDVPPPQPQGPYIPPPQSIGMKNKETDAYRCALARDILNNSVRRVGGPSFDNHDREVARGDIRSFCK